MRKFLMSVVAGTVFCASLNAQQELLVHPVPQQCVEREGSVALPESYRLDASQDSGMDIALALLDSIMPGANGGGKFTVRIGVKGDKAVKRYESRIPEVAEGYYLETSKDGIVIAAADSRGAYYGVQTLAHLVRGGKLPIVEIADYPDIPFRGVVEGFYGKPWSHEARLSQLDFYGRNKMNVYIYGPKDDPYHSTPDWRKPYPEKEAAQLRELTERAAANGVMFYWAIHPGQDIKWNDEDRSLLVRKFESMYGLGVRGFAVFFDDISGEGTRADKQAELLNYLDDNFVKVKGDVAPLIICPTEYNKSWAKLEGGYLTTLGDMLNPGIQVMWTGNKVVANIDRATLDFINPLIKRKAYIWWNFPVSDYVQDHLLMGEVYGNGTDIKDEMSAFVSNPMEHAEASKIALYSIAGYTWNMEDYDSGREWEMAIRDLMPENARYLRTFAIHNSDLGQNGHKFRRKESENIRQALDALCDAYKDGRIDTGAFAQVEEECLNISEAADKLLLSGENPGLVEEMSPWLVRFKLTGLFGTEVLRAMRLKQAGDMQGFSEAYGKARSLHAYIGLTKKLLNQQSRDKGVESASLHLYPALESLFLQLSETSGR